MNTDIKPPMTPLSSQDLEALKALARIRAEDLRKMSQSPDVTVEDRDGGMWSGSLMWAGLTAVEGAEAIERLLSHITALEAEKAEARRLALEEAAETVKRMLDPFPDGINPGNYDDGYVTALYNVQAAIIALKERT